VPGGLSASVVAETYSEVQEMDIVTSVAVADGSAAELTSKKLLGEVVGLRRRSQESRSTGNAAGVSAAGAWYHEWRRGSWPRYEPKWSRSCVRSTG
jgi:hypothetical protein